MIYTVEAKLSRAAVSQQWQKVNLGVSTYTVELNWKQLSRNVI